jgi:GT2 family glycosyltransferase
VVNRVMPQRIFVTRQSGTREHAAAPTQAPSVSILIATHADAHLLRKSLPVFLANAPRAVEVLILNNDPPQDVRAAIGEPGADPRVRILEMGYEAGFSRAINRGIRESSGELVMFCDADVFPSAGYLSGLLSLFERCPLAGAAAGKILRYELDTDRATDVIDTAGLELNRQRRLTPRGEGERDRGELDEEIEVFGLDGAAMIVRRAALESIRFRDEYLDENFVTHKEDHDVSWRLRLAGWQCWYVPSALAHHARTTRGLASTPYRAAIRRFHRNELAKSEVIRINAMKNQWLMLLKNEDFSNLIRDFPFIFGREALIAIHRLLFTPKSLAAIPMTLRLVPQTLEKRRAAKRRQRMDPRALRFWLGRPTGSVTRVKEPHR